MKDLKLTFVVDEMPFYAVSYSKSIEIQTDKDRDFAFGIFGDIINHVKEKAVFRFSGENQPEFTADSGVIQNFSF